MKILCLMIGICQLTFTFAVPLSADGMDGCRGSTKVISAEGDMEGVISSPGYSDGRYPPNLNCSYRIETFEEFEIELYFMDLKLEVSDSCVRDKLVIREPRKGGEDVILTYCGRESPRNYRTKGNVIEVQFVTDEIGTYWGFRFQWNAFYKNNRVFCKGFLCKNRRCVDNSSKCDGDDDCMDGTDEEGCDYIPDKNQTCGIPKIPPKAYLIDRIVGGGEARPGSWPWMADLHDVSIFPSGHICGGTLLNAQWVITTALCFTNLRKARDWRVKLGNHEKFNFNEGEQVRYVTRIVFYGSINREAKDTEDLENDVALVKLNAPVKITHFVQPACLPKEYLETLNGTKCYSTGWGETQGTGSSDVLKQVVVSVLPNKTCDDAFGDEFEEKNMICAGSTGAMNALCTGDSGGPLVCQSKDDTWTLHGIVTMIPWKSTGTRIVCGLRNTHSVFHKVSKRVKWIKETIEE